jgi:nucleoside-diphosphate-sugar epimerase
VAGTLSLLLAARDAGCRRVVFASSSAVYGDSPALPKHEAMLSAPLSPYASSKLAGKELCAVFARAYDLEDVGESGATPSGSGAPTDAPTRPPTAWGSR